MVPSFCQYRTIFWSLGKLAAQVLTSFRSWRTAPLIFIWLGSQSLGGPDVYDHHLRVGEPAFYRLLAQKRQGSLLVEQDQVNATIRLTTHTMAHILGLFILHPFSVFRFSVNQIPQLETATASASTPAGRRFVRPGQRFSPRA